MREIISLFKELESMTLVANSMVGGRQAGAGAVAESLHLIHRHEAETEFIGNTKDF